MNIGMLWFDNDPKAGLPKKVERAAVYYRNKYGWDANLCYVHPSMMQGAAPVTTTAGNISETYTAAGVEVRTTRSVLPNHLWIGRTTAGEA